LLVPEADVPKLHLAATRGKLTLSLRGEDDEINNQPPKAYGSELTSAQMNQAEQQPKIQPTQVTPVAPIPAVEPHQVTVVRGFGGKSVERTVFASDKSYKVLEVSNGMPTRASAALRPSAAGASHRATQSDFGNRNPDADTSGTPDERTDTKPDDVIGDE
jgi:hypothetical protein